MPSSINSGPESGFGSISGATKNQNTTGGSIEEIKNGLITLTKTNARLSAKARIVDTLTKMKASELSKRESTLSIAINDKLTGDMVEKILQEHWNDITPVIFKDRSYINIEFDSKEYRDKFIQWCNTDPEGASLRYHIKEPDHYGFRFTKRPARLELSRVMSHFKKDNIEKYLKRLMDKRSNGSGIISDFREGKTLPHSTRRNITFSTNAKGLEVLIENFRGKIKYKEPGSERSMTLVPQILVKPRFCNICLSIKLHDFNNCKEAKCTKCAKPGHKRGSCTETVKFCNTCNTKGHETVDLNCFRYLEEVEKELNKIDIPPKFLQSSSLRLILADHLKLI